MWLNYSDRPALFTHEEDEKEKGEWECWLGGWLGDDGGGVIREQCKQVRRKSLRTESEGTMMGVSVRLRKTSKGMATRLAVQLVGWLFR